MEMHMQDKLRMIIQYWIEDYTDKQMRIRGPYSCIDKMDHIDLERQIQRLHIEGAHLKGIRQKRVDNHMIQITLKIGW